MISSKATGRCPPKFYVPILLTGSSHDSSNVDSNQPKLRVKIGDEKDTLLFKFVSATNLASKDDAHMHEGKLEFIDKDNIRSTWVMFVNSKAKEEHSFEMTRKK